MGIIAVLATMMIVSLRSANEKARIAKVSAEFKQIEIAAEFLEMDTGYYVGACRRDLYKYEIGPGPSINPCDSVAGLCIQPILGSRSWWPDVPPDDIDDCAWTQEKVNKWKGPYMPVGTKNPWGIPYMFHLICRRNLYLACSNINEILGPYADPNVRGPCIVAMVQLTNRCKDIVYPILPD